MELKAKKNVFTLNSRSLKVAVLLATYGIAQTVSAQQGGNTPAVEEVVVTGTLIRGQAPVGSPITTVGRDQIESTNAATTQDILRMIPNTSNSHSVAQGQLVGSSYFAPTIRSLGSSASTSTLVLIDSHRIPLGNTSHPLPDPSIVPSIAIERVEVIADGSSSVYGSDAVAGVVNFITRTGYDGLMITGQGGWGDDYDTKDMGLLWGTNWGEGSAMLAYNYSYKSALASSSRGLLDRDKRPLGGTNFMSRVCEPATIQPAGAGIYRSVTATTPMSDPNACQETVSDHIPDQTRHNVMAKMRQDLSSDITVKADLLYSWRENLERQSRGSIQGSAFATGDQANPFYENPPGITATRQTLRLLPDELFGPGRTNTNTGEAYYATGEIQWDINENFTLTGFGMVGRTETKSTTVGAICSSCAYLALNGTTNGAGNLNAPSIPGTNIRPTLLPLTTENALDLWRPAATNRTNPAVLEQIASEFSEGRVNQSIQQYRVILDGDLFELPAGTLRGAIGGELVKYTVTPQQVSSNGIGLPNSAAAFVEYVEQDVESVFAELLIPVIGPAQGISFINSFELSLSVRRDEYPLFGSTTNPKFGFDWEVVEGFKVRGSTSESFVAPPMSTTANRYTFSQHGAVGGTVNIPVANFPEARQIPGCENVATHCSVGSSTSRPGMFRLHTDPNMAPQTGESWSIGFDWAPVSWDGRLAVTYFENEFRGGVTAANFNMIVNTPGMEEKLAIYPNGATRAQINAHAKGTRLASELDPNNVYFFFNRDMANVVNLNIGGWDIQGDYNIETSNLGRFTLGGSVLYIDKFDQFFGANGEVFSVLGTQGFNQTFSSVDMQVRADIGWEYGDFRARMFAYYTPSHLNWSSTSMDPIGLTSVGNPAGSGGDKVDAFTTIDINLSYNLSSIPAFGGALSDSVVFLDINNVFDEEPPFFNSPEGYGPYNANPIGRVVSAGVRFRF